MTTTKEQQQAWLREHWGEPEVLLGSLDGEFCDGCDATDEPLWKITGLLVCSAECAVTVLEDVHSGDIDGWATDASDFRIYEDVQAMVEGRWPPRKPLEELRAAVEVRIAAWQCDPRPEAYHRLKSYDDVMNVIDRLLAGESLEEAS